jgi:PleD family two-component response regulator
VVGAQRRRSAALPLGLARRTSSAGVRGREFNGSESAQAVVGRADAALYEAKAQGRDRIIIAPGACAQVT